MSAFDFSLRVGQHNAYYEGAYGESEMRWRRICAVEKAANLKSLLGARAAGIKTVLEVGCGTGAVLHEVKALGIGSVHHGIDMADPNLHADGEALRDGLSFHEYDGTTMPYADKSIDLVFASHVLEHVPHERGFLGEMARVCAKFIYIEVPCELHARSNVRKLQTTLDIGHINAYTPEGFALKLATSGLDIVDLQVLDHRDEVYLFKSSSIKARMRMMVRRGLLAANAQLATRMFCYHCGALCVVRGD